MKNRFYPRKYSDHRIVGEDGITVGHIRVKPSGVLWAPRDAKVWHRISLQKFARFCEKYGKKQQK